MKNRNAILINQVLRHAPNERAVYTNPADKFYYTPESVRLMGMWVCSGCGAYNMEHEWVCVTCNDEKHMLRLEQRDMIEANNVDTPAEVVKEDEITEDMPYVLSLRTNYNMMDFDFIFSEYEEPYILRPLSQGWKNKLKKRIDYILLSRRGILRRYHFVGAMIVNYHGKRMYRINLKPII